MKTATKLYIAGEAGRLCEKHNGTLDKGAFVIELLKMIEEALEWQDKRLGKEK